MKVFHFLRFCLTISYLTGSALSLTSPCPTIFQYKTTTLSAAEYQSWSGVLYLQQDYDRRVSVDVLLDRAITHLSAHHFDVVTSDWKKFHLSGRNQTSTHSDQNRIFLTAEFNGQNVPQVEEIRLNGARICPVAVRTTTSRSYDPSTRLEPRSTFAAEDPYRENNFYRPTTERINSLYDANNNRNANNNNDENSRRRVNGGADSTRTSHPSSSSSSSHNRPSSTMSSNSNSQFDWNNSNNNRETTSRSVINYTTRRQTPTTTSTTTPSPYFPGDLHMLFQSNGNDRRRPTENPLAAESCGTISPSITPLVINGETAHEGQFPWHAALYISQGVQLKYTCGGNLIAQKLVLTAAHCVTLRRSTSAMNPEHLLVYLGKSDLLHWQGHEQDNSVSEVIIHPHYNNSRFYADLALLKLKKQVRYTDHVRPVCLWRFSDDLKAVVDRVGRVPGWGYNENGVVGTELSYVEMPIVTHETCIWSNREVFSKITSESSFCAGFRNGSSVCNGDSGGGLVFNQSGRWYLRGIVSVSVAMQNHFLCDPDHYVVFGDVAKFKSWFDNYL